MVPWRARMARTLTRNQEHYRRALQRLPLGVASNFRFWGVDRTLYVKHGRGARLTGLDGNVYGDFAMWYTPMDKWARVGDPEVYPYSEGIPLSTRHFAHFVQANDADQLEDVLKRHGHSIACLLIEPIMGNCLGIAADPAYVRAARELCDRSGVVMIIDEVKTGFRVARGGVQELYAVRAGLV